MYLLGERLETIPFAVEDNIASAINCITQSDYPKDAEWPL